MDITPTSDKIGDDFDHILERRFMHIFDVFSEGLFHMDEQGVMVFYNHQFYEQFGINTGVIELEAWLEIVHPLDRARLSSKVDEHLESVDSRVTTEYRVRKPNGQYVWIEGTAVTRHSEHGSFMVGSHKDISERKLMESYIHQVAFHDNASGMANRSRLLLDIDEFSRATTLPYSLIYIQIEEIKSYLSHYGTEILNHVVHSMLTAVSHLPGQVSKLYRVSDDDFAIMIEGNFTDRQLTNICEKIKTRYHDAVMEQGQLLGCGISMGIYPKLNAVFSAEEILRKATRTSQFASKKKASRIAVYSATTQQVVDRFFYIEQGLKEAIESQSLTVKFQPIICANSLEVASFESLVRWRSEEFGEIYPDEFIPVAENKGLIVDLGYFVLRKACKFIRDYNQRHQRNTRVNVNVSVLQLLNSNFPSRVHEIVSEYQIAPKNLVIELTETLILDNNLLAIEQLKQLAELGFNLSLDDFGSGYSSLNTFFDLPMSQIKIDKSMAWRTVTNSDSKQYLAFLIKLCQKNKIDVVIEGIETPEMYKVFRKMGATYLQGYWFSKPLSIASASRYTLAPMSDS
ncbi:putative bifunctional diguanylate cyclase/phosphodiesterase [Vibrio navarrensis]|uniref:putative bifunctional diguanylate cyclase/phosphodiesterase n=1 Tax=Vibrio navarrensis TaxID=29495 RepID=UPI00186A7B84|nr:EAL domain-containing protein [Vibrio navarrensis]MBE4617485.1 sensor domain-containing phosphodiesterase [Vibrio navarrensis]